MTPDEEVLSEIINRRGYLVIRSIVTMTIGEKPNWRNALGQKVTDQPMQVFAATDERDYMEQMALFEELGTGVRIQGSAGDRYYRVTTD